MFARSLIFSVNIWTCHINYFHNKLGIPFSLQNGFNECFLLLVFSCVQMGQAQTGHDINLYLVYITGQLIISKNEINYAKKMFCRYTSQILELKYFFPFRTFEGILKHNMFCVGVDSWGVSSVWHVAFVCAAVLAEEVVAAGRAGRSRGRGPASCGPAGRCAARRAPAAPPASSSTAARPAPPRPAPGPSCPTSPRTWFFRRTASCKARAATSSSENYR